MNNRVYELLVFLINNKNKEFHLLELGDYFNVNVRTIRNHISIIEDFLIDNDFQNILIKNNSKVSFIGEKAHINEILNIAAKSDFYDYRLSSEERQIIISIMLLLSDEPITIADFEDALFASRSSIKKDISLARNILNKYGVSFSENKRYGYILDIDESTRRNVIYSFLKEKELSNSNSLDTSGDICLYYIKHQINFNFYKSMAENALYILEPHFCIAMTDIDFNEILILLCIICYRLDKKRIIEDYVGDIHSDDIFCEISEYALRLIMNDRGFSKGDILYLADKLRYKITYKNNTPVNQELINYYIIVNGFLYNLSQAFNINLQEEYKLQEFLTAHIARVCHRIKEGDSLINPYKDQLISTYPKDFKILRDNINFLEENLNVRINEDESSYILMHIEASLEKIRQGLIIPAVIIVCHVGFGTSHFLAERLSKHFKLNILEIISSHKFKEYMQKRQLNCDLIISTIPLIGISIPWIQVNPILSDDDIVHINILVSDFLNKITPYKAVTKIDKNKESMIDSFANEKYENLKIKPTILKEKTFSSLLTNELIILDKEVENWKEAIILSGEPLLWKDVITPNYIRAVVNNVIDNGPYFVFAPGVAIAHASPKDGAKKLGASFVRLEKPVKFGHKTNDPINIIIMISIIDTKKNLNMLFTTMNTLCNPKAFNKFISAKDKNDIVNIFKYYEDNNVKKEEAFRRS